MFDHVFGVYVLNNFYVSFEDVLVFVAFVSAKAKAAPLSMTLTQSQIATRFNSIYLELFLGRTHSSQRKLTRVWGEPPSTTRKNKH